MRQGPPQNGRRPRGRHHGGNGHSGGNGNQGGMRNNGGAGGNSGGDSRPRSAASLRHQTFDSNCIDLRVRGNAWQVHEKYQALARDAQSAGDRVAAENYQQHAEHYFRIIEAINEATALEQRQNGRPPGAPSFGGQPEVPTNYYGGDSAPSGAHGQNAEPQPANGVAAAAQTQQQVVPSEAEVRQPQAQQPSPFFTPDEMEASDGMQPLVARR